MKSKWEYKTLGDVVSFVADGDWIESRYQSDNGFRLIQTGNIGNGIFKAKEDKPHYISEKTFDELKCTEIFKGDCLISRLPDPIGRACIIPDFGSRMITAVDCTILRFKDFVLPKFFVLYSQSDKYGKEIGKKTTGSTRKRISRKNLENIPIPVPPKDEQQRIVAELDLLTSIIDKQNAQLKELDTLAQSIFYDMFGDPIENPKGWEVKKFQEACYEIGDGLHGTPKYDSNGSFAFINGNNLIGGRIVITDKTQFVNDDEAKKIFVSLNENTVLLSINGTLGKTALYNNEKVVLGKSACYCKLKDILLSKFVISLMNTDKFQLFLENNSSKSTIKNVGLKAIRNYDMIIPPLALQQIFADKIQSIEKQKTAVNQSIAETQKLLDYTMDKYFG